MLHVTAGAKKVLLTVPPKGDVDAMIVMGVNEDALQAMFLFPRDIERVPTEVNRLNNQVLVSIYDAEWKRWF